MTGPFEPPPDDSPIDPNPPYPGPPATGHYFPAPPPPPPGYPGSYPPSWDTGRPSGLAAAGVLGYVDAGLLVLAALLLLAGASAVDSWNDAFGSNDSGITTELALDGLVNLLSAGLQIAGGITMTSRSQRGRILFTVGAAVCVAAGFYWIVRVHAAGIVVWTAVFVALPIIGLSLAWTREATGWLRGQR
jgi:hypothetical protein